MSSEVPSEANSLLRLVAAPPQPQEAGSKGKRPDSSALEGDGCILEDDDDEEDDEDEKDGDDAEGDDASRRSKQSRSEKKSRKAMKCISGGVKVQTPKVKGFVDLDMHFSRDQLMGSAFVAFGIVLFVGFFYAAVVSKLLPSYENRLLSAIQNDRYYCLLVPLTLPVIIVAVYLHWLSMKMFKHA